MKHIYLTALLLATLTTSLIATTGETNQDGAFDDNSVWDCPAGETYQTVDTLIIQHNLEIGNNNIETVAASLIIVQSGVELFIGSNGKLVLTTLGAKIIVENNALLRTHSNSQGTLIEINGVGVWGNGCAGCNNEEIPGYVEITENSSPGNPNLLPIKLNAFHAALHQEGVKLTWKTAAELNNDYFTVMRSTDGARWEEIITIEGAGTTNQSTSYEFVDKEIADGHYYYKLKQTDFDGKFTYSDIATINAADEVAVNIYPNPAQHELSVSTTAGAFEVTVIDPSGKIVERATGDGQVMVDVRKLTAGIYLVKVRANNAVPQTKQIIIQ